MKNMEWEIFEDNYQEKITIPKTIRAEADEAGVDLSDNVAIRLTNLKTGEEYLSRLNITGTEIYVPVEAQRMLEGAQKIRLKIY